MSRVNTKRRPRYITPRLGSAQHVAPLRYAADRPQRRPGLARSSLTHIETILAAAPSTQRGLPTPLSADPKGERIAYASGKSVFVRSIDDPAQSKQYTQHTANTTVARFSPSGFYVASGDASGTVKVWDCVGEGATKGAWA